MRQLWTKLMAGTACIVGFIILLGVIGYYDYTEQVILRMSYEEYDSVKALLTEQNGREPSEREIAHWWVERNR